MEKEEREKPGRRASKKSVTDPGADHGEASDVGRGSSGNSSAVEISVGHVLNGLAITETAFEELKEKVTAVTGPESPKTEEAKDEEDIPGDSELVRTLQTFRRRLCSLTDNLMELKDRIEL